MLRKLKWRYLKRGRVYRHLVCKKIARRTGVEIWPRRRRPPTAGNIWPEIRERAAGRSHSPHWHIQQVPVQRHEPLIRNRGPSYNRFRLTLSFSSFYKTAASMCMSRGPLQYHLCRSLRPRFQTVAGLGKNFTPRGRLEPSRTR